MMTVTRPLLRYHGGKWKLAPWIISHMPAHRRYVEPFMGAASVLLRKPRAHNEILNDLDGEIVGLFRVVRDEGSRLAEQLSATPFSRFEYEQAWEPAECPIERARRVVIRSFMGFGSAAATESRPNCRIMTGFRGISDRSGTTPCHDWMNYPDALLRVIERLKGVVIENRPALEVIDRYDAGGTLFYLDPPYVFSSRADRESDYRHEMDDQAHEALLRRLQNLKGRFLLSGYDSPVYRELCAGWRCVKKSAFADGARLREEMLWMNFEPEGVLL